MAQLLNPCSASFASALLIPFYRSSGFAPRLCFPSLVGLGPKPVDLDAIRSHAQDLKYYMSLALSPQLGSALWSIFWQPDVECNLVSPWLSSALDTLQPYLETRDVETVLKVFALRRPRVAFLWAGIFLLGDSTIFEWIIKYLQTLEERYGYASQSNPDVSFAAWIGTPQSYLDFNPKKQYLSETDRVPRSDVLRYRFNYRLERLMTISAWKPFGSIAKSDIELELWPLLDSQSASKYVRWVWKSSTEDAQFGFQVDTNRCVHNVPDQLDLIKPAQYDMKPPVMTLIPSKLSTLRMLNQAVESVSGDKHMGYAGLLVSPRHPWLADWRGLP
ncbi:hypothetical protein PG987_001891 [Apiospora arundinis]